MNPSPHVCSATPGRQNTVVRPYFSTKETGHRKVRVATAQLQRDGGAAVCGMLKPVRAASPSASEEAVLGLQTRLRLTNCKTKDLRTDQLSHNS